MIKLTDQNKIEKINNTLFQFLDQKGDKNFTENTDLLLKVLAKLYDNFNVVKVNIIPRFGDGKNRHRLKSWLTSITIKLSTGAQPTVSLEADNLPHSLSYTIYEILKHPRRYL